MAESRSQDSFAKAFVPGLVLGLVVGAFAGVVLVDVFSGPSAPDMERRELTPEQREALRNMPRDAREGEAILEENVEIPEDEPADPTGGEPEDDDGSTGG